MLKFDRYLLSECVQATLATTLVLLMVAFGAVFADVLRDIAEGRVPADMLLPQLGLLFLNWLPIILPLALMLGLMLALGRLYRDSEMPVLASVGIGPRRMAKPLFGLIGPVAVVIALCSLWLAPWAERTSKEMVNAATRNLLVAGLEPGRFTPIGNGGVVFVSRMSTDGTHFERVFIYRQKNDRLDVTTAKTGHLEVDDEGHRILVLDDGFEVEGPREGVNRDYRLMRYRANEAEMPATKGRYDANDPRMLSTPTLLADARREAKAELHSRIAPPLLAVAFALLAVPLARSSPREGRFGRIAVGFLIYLVGTMLSLASVNWITKGKIPVALGQWWLVLPLLALGAWMYLNDGRVRAPRLRGARR
ncbi:LPS export ABC transporter permease LptF [Cognatilysobacter terrigena]|uniref:LPS export ABC transporter permease LptF n=1 Tax=Cognatilysobacter terrigena TaxID=2488749 RepID=UPI00105BCF39|nr:LPS export ABC transporter permease LptF [Lysobacter terrigena]